MNIKTSFSVCSDCSSYVIITIEKKDNSRIELEYENNIFEDMILAYTYESVSDFCNVLRKCFLDDGIDESVNAILTITSLDEIKFVRIENSLTEWNVDEEEIDVWEETYDQVEYNEENGFMTGIDITTYIFKNGRAYDKLQQSEN